MFVTENRFISFEYLYYIPNRIRIKIDEYKCTVTPVLANIKTYHKNLQEIFWQNTDSSRSSFHNYLRLKPNYWQRV